tara:strand:- start:1396 stop:2193 length:798 start_codon:yes stop_codon:yes gene_type:complete
MAASSANKAASRNYAYQLKVRERKWMGERSLYQTKTVQHSQQVDLANIAAQRAFTRTQISLNNAQSLAMLQNEVDWKKMMINEGKAEVSFAERGIGGKGMARALSMNKANYGMSQAMRTRGLTMAQNDAKYANESINRQLKSALNQSFSSVALQPIPDVAPPAPVMQNAMLSAILGGAAAGLAAYTPDKGGKGGLKNNTDLGIDKMSDKLNSTNFNSNLPNNTWNLPSMDMGYPKMDWGNFKGVYGGVTPSSSMINSSVWIGAGS